MTTAAGSAAGHAVVSAMRVAVGLGIGAGTALVDAGLLVPAAAALVVPALRPRVRRAAAVLTAFELSRVRALLGGDSPPSAPHDLRAARYLVARMPVGLLGGVIMAVVIAGLAAAGALLWSWISATPYWLDPGFVASTKLVAYYALPGMLLLYLGLAGLAGVAAWERALVRRLLAPSREEQLAMRVAALAESRAAIVAAVDDERRRIERDLHDGVQQRLVALGMLLGRARRHPGRPELLEQAHEQAQRALVELREVSWRVYPAALDTEGLAAALESVAERAPLPVRISCALNVEPPAEVRAVAWFVVCEAVTNAAKHSGAGKVLVDVVGTASALCVAVTDDGRGGADPTGGGLAGLARRVAAADGTLTITSPAGGPTVVRAELPCG
jgi:signal transduction histidine kinase